MDAAAIRTLTSELADDLAWLEQHCRKQPQLAERAGELRLAAALVQTMVAATIESDLPSAQALGSINVGDFGGTPGATG